MDIDDIEKEFQRIKTCLDCGRDCLARKKFAESKAFFEEALALCDRGHSRQHPDRLQCLEQLSDTLIAMKDFDAAASTLSELKDSTDAGQSSKGSEIMLLLKLSYCLEKSSRLREAGACYENLIDLIEVDQGVSSQTQALIIERYQSVLSRMSVRGAKVKELESRARTLRKQAFSSEAQASRLLDAVEDLYGEGSKQNKDSRQKRSLRTFDSAGPLISAQQIAYKLQVVLGVIVVIALLVMLTRPVSEGQFQSKEQQYFIAKSSCLAGDYQKAATIFDRLLAQDPRLVACYWYNGGCKVKLGEYDKAIENYSALIDHIPDCEPAFVGRAGAYLFKQDFEKALTDCDSAIRINSKDAKAHDFRGAALVHLLRMKEADLDLQKAMEISGPKRDAYIWTALPDPLFPKEEKPGKGGAAKGDGKAVGPKP